METAFKEFKNNNQKIMFGILANFYAKLEANLRTSTYHSLDDIYMNLYLRGQSGDTQFAFLNKW